MDTVASIGAAVQNATEQQKRTSTLNTFALVGITVVFVFLRLLLKAFVNGEAHGNFMRAVEWSPGYGLFYALVAVVSSVVHSLLSDGKNRQK